MLPPLLLVLVLLLIPVHSFADVQGFARVVVIEGDVQIRVADTDDWVPAAVNTPLYEGDSVWTPAQSRTELQLHDGTVIRLDGRSSLNILQVEEDALQFHLGIGRIYVRTGDMKRWSMQFDLDDSTVKIIDKARLRLEITDNGEEEISVYRGSAYVESYGGRTRVRKGEMLSVEDARAEISPINPPDSWDKWNTGRDGRSAQRTGSSGHLPEELVIYEDELTSSGEWLEVQAYGRVWRPTMGTAPDWAPYRSGRWVWREGDYVWVSTEPWGWAPYHYGRWAVIRGLGWCWVPPLTGDVFWAPAFVGWITTPAFVGWVPLAPGEIYYGRRHYGRQSVTVTNVTNITVANTASFYRNSGQWQAVTSVERSAFISGKGRYSTRSADSFRKENITMGRPEPKPHTKEVLMPQVRTIPVAKLPPTSVAELSARKLKERFPKLDRGGVFIPQPDKNRSTGVGASQEGRQGKNPVASGAGTPAKGAASSRSPALKPVLPQATEARKPSRDLPAAGRNSPEKLSEQPAVETTKGQPSTGSQRDDVALPVIKQEKKLVITEPAAVPKDAASGNKPPVQPAVPQANVPNRPFREVPVSERKSPEQGRHGQPASETGSKPQSRESKRSESRPTEVKPAVTPRPIEMQSDRKGPSAERHEQNAGKRDQGSKAPEKARDSRGDGSKATAPPERKTTNVWKIMPQEEAQPAKEKK